MRNEMIQESGCNNFNKVLQYFKTRLGLNLTSDETNFIKCAKQNLHIYRSKTENVRGPREQLTASKQFVLQSNYKLLILCYDASLVIKTGT